MKSHRRILQERDCDELHQGVEPRKQSARSSTRKNLKPGRRDKCSSLEPYLYNSQFLEAIQDRHLFLLPLLSQRKSQITEDADTRCDIQPQKRASGMSIRESEIPNQPKRNPCSDVSPRQATGFLPTCYEKLGSSDGCDQ